VLPTERLLANGMCVPALRADLRRIDDGRNALSVALLWAGAVGVVAAAVLLDQPWAYAVAFVVMGPVYVRFTILMHEAAHRLLFSNRRLNDIVGTWVIAYPAFTPIALYRRVHIAHHRQEFGPDEPDTAFYSGYPCERRALARRLLRDAVGVSGWKNLRPLLLSLRSSRTRAVGASILGVQAALWALSWAATGRWWIYLLLWFGPWMTQWRVLNRLRALGEHGGLVAGDDRRVSTHHVRQHWLARLWLVPYHTGWHLAHHVDMGIPWRKLPAFHDELVRAGYVTDALTYPSYRALWRTMVSGGPVVSAA
jgi:fatty acid desaturase